LRARPGVPPIGLARVYTSPLLEVVGSLERVDSVTHVRAKALRLVEAPAAIGAR